MGEPVSTPWIAAGDGFAADVANDRTAFHEALAGLDALGDALALSDKARFNLALVVEEIGTNILKYAFDESADGRFGITVIRTDDVLTVTFVDGGVPFDPLAAEAPEKPLSINDAQVAGFGLVLVRKAAQDLTYQRTDAGFNRLEVTLAA